jgi:hypothetical protein
MSFFQKPMGATLLLGTALGTPYLLYETEPGIQLRKSVSLDEGSSVVIVGTTESAAASGPFETVLAPQSVNPHPDEFRSGAGDRIANIAYQMPIDLRSVIRFDVTPDFVYRNFPRVSTVLSDLSYDGLRVPLVSGTQPYDVAGSLTYYFDNNKSVRRIQFQGVTGEADPLVQLMIQHYRLSPERSLGGQLLTMRWNNRITSFMHVAPAPVVTAQEPNARFAFFLEINKPSDYYGLSQEAILMLTQAQAAQRW